MTDALRLSFEVGCSTAHAFAVWTSGIGTWWPRDHTVTGDPDLEVVLQPRVGGRIYERTGTGVKHEWGEVTAWEPPDRLRYRWYLGSAPAQATDVEIRFVARAHDRTEVVIAHDGWERLAHAGAELRDRNRHGWQTLLPHFVSAVATGGS